MDEKRLKYLATYILGSKEFKELAEEYIKRYSRQAPQTELETIRNYERIRFIQELCDTGEYQLQHYNEKEG